MLARPDSMADGPLHLVRVAYESGRFGEALRLIDEAAKCGGASQAGAAPGAAALRWRAMAAFRIGELGQAADAAVSVIDRGAGASLSAEDRFDVLCISVIAAGELLRFEQSIHHMRLASKLAQGTGRLADWVRARGTAAACFALLGDPWAGQRLMAEVAGTFQAMSDQPRLEATVRGNHASICILIARRARLAGDAARADEAVDHARSSVDRSREIAAATGDARLKAFADVHSAELALIGGHGASALAMLKGRLAEAREHGLNAHVRQLALLEAEALLACNDADAAQALLDALAMQVHDGHEWSVHVRLHAQLRRAFLMRGDGASADRHGAECRRREHARWFRQDLAKSQLLRERVELEDLYRFRPGDQPHGGGGR